MDCRIIKSPGENTLAILNRRKGSKEELGTPDAVGLVQGKLIEMICATDVAEKAVGVTIEDIRGSCPQNMILLAIFGDTASVTAAIEEIKKERRITNGNCNLNGYYLGYPKIRKIKWVKTNVTKSLAVQEMVNGWLSAM
ncbi:BMC domain-containing protein [Enterococcus termitis]